MSEIKPMRCLHKCLAASTLRFLRDRQGLAAIEFAFIAPVLLLLYFGTVDVTNWYMAHRRLVVAGSTIADLTTQNGAQVTGTDIKNFWAGIGKIVEPLPIDSVALTLRDFRKNGTSSKQQWQYSYRPTAWPADTPTPVCGGTRSVTELQSLATTEMSDANDILSAEVCTTIKPIALQVFGFKDIEMRFQINMRPRLGKTLDCTSGCT